MRKVFVLISIFLFLLISQPKTANAAEPSCDATVNPSEGVAGETKFLISGNISNFPRNADASISIIANNKDFRKIHTVSTFSPSLTLDANNNGKLDQIQLNPFNIPGEYVAYINYTTTTRGTISHFLCPSNTFTVNPSLIPTKLECNPPGRDQEDQSKCGDSRCTPTGKNQCILNTIVAPSPTPTPTPISPFPPCAKWVYFYDDPEGRCKDKDRISTLNSKDPKNNCRLNDEIIQTDNKDYSNPEFKDRKCVAIQTGIGEISTEPQGFVKRIFSFVLGIAGGIALILIIIAGYRLMASAGNPEALTAARDQLISAIVGLLFIIFSFVILEVIGVDILKIPGFNP